jgi:hypothetical protein
VKRLATFIQGAVRAVAVLSVGILGCMTAGCYDVPENTPIVSGANFRPAVNLVTPVSLANLSGVPCPLGGVAFATPINLVVTAGVQDLTLNSVTIHMIDGTNLGGPSITIPQPELSSRFGSTVIIAGSTRDFALRADFGCIAVTPVVVTSSAVLTDRRGIQQTIVAQSKVR